MTIDWKNAMRTNGYAVFPDLLPEGLAQNAFNAIEADLRENFDPSQQTAYDNQSYCPGLKDTPPIMDLLTNKPFSDLLDAALGVENIGWDGGQIAIRRAHNVSEDFAPTPHIDGFASSTNGLTDGKIYNHTVLVGVFLTPAVGTFAGNFTIWPGSHYIYENHFRDRGERAIVEPMPVLDLGEPLQLECRSLQG